MTFSKWVKFTVGTVVDLQSLSFLRFDSFLTLTANKNNFFCKNKIKSWLIIETIEIEVKKKIKKKAADKKYMQVL